jgi:hypothetical protein
LHSGLSRLDIFSGIDGLAGKSPNGIQADLVNTYSVASGLRVLAGGLETKIILSSFQGKPARLSRDRDHHSRRIAVKNNRRGFPSDLDPNLPVVRSLRKVEFYCVLRRGGDIDVEVKHRTRSADVPK